MKSFLGEKELVFKWYLNLHYFCMVNIKNKVQPLAFGKNFRRNFGGRVWEFVTVLKL